MEYRREIDGLRAIAVLSVVFFHAGIDAFNGGFVGVDVFFVISGYLITKIIIEEIDRQAFSLMNFYDRRARRILPALALVLAVCIPFSWWLLPPTEMKDFSESVFATMLFSSNILFWTETGYFATAAELKPLLHTWSLAVEEQFYLFFPLFLMVFWRFGKRTLVILLLLLLLSSLALAHWAVSAKPSAAFFLLPTRGWELLVGALAAFFLQSGASDKTQRLLRELCGLLGLFLIFVSVLVYDNSTPFPGLHALMPTVGTLLIIVFATQQTLVGRWIGNKFLVAIGLISYSAYLWHHPIFAYAKYSSIPPSWAFSAVLIVLVFLLAHFSWKYVETPFRDRRRFSRRKIMSLSAAVVMIFSGFGIIGHVADGFASRPHLLKFSDLSYDVSRFKYIQCDRNLAGVEPTLSSCYGEGSIPTALMIGDSHADDKFNGIERVFPEYNWMMLGNSSCPPLKGVEFRSLDGIVCTERMEKIFSYVDAQASVELVILSFIHMYPLRTLVAADHLRLGFNADDSLIKDLENPALGRIDAFYSGLDKSIAFLRENNIDVVILLDIPELGFFPMDCLQGKVPCGFNQSDVLERQKELRSRLADLKRRYPEVNVFDPLEIFCPDRSCSILRDGRSMYRDSHHLSHYGGEVYGIAFREWYSKIKNIDARDSR